MGDLHGKADVERLINAFYAQVRKDPVLAHFFIQVDWAHHTPRIVAFWDGLLFGKGGYSGDVMTPHVVLDRRHRLEGRHFDRWMELFSSTVDALYEGPKAREAVARARSIAGVMAHRIAQRT